MANTSVTYTATGGQTDFTITFSYLDTSHVFCEVNGVAASVTFPTSSTVRLSSGATSGDTVVVYRKTPTASRQVDFVGGTTLTENDLDTDSLAAFYHAQELYDQSDRSIKAPYNDTVNELPIVANRANKLLGFDANGDPQVYGSAPVVDTITSSTISVSASDVSWVTSITALIALGAQTVQKTVMVSPNGAATSYPAIYIYDVSASRSDHDGILVIDPAHTAAPNTTAFYASENSGTGAWRLASNWVFLSTFVTDGDVATDQSPAFNGFLSALATSGRKGIIDATIRLGTNAGHTYSTSATQHLEIEQLPTARLYVEGSANQPLSFSNSWYLETTLSAEVLIDGVDITCTSVSGVSVGDQVKILPESLLSSSTTFRAGAVYRVDAISGNTITLDRPVKATWRENNRQRWSGDGSTTAFTYRTFSDPTADVVVKVGGVTQTITTDYTLGTWSGGELVVTFTSPPGAGVDVDIESGGLAVYFRKPSSLRWKGFNVVTNGDPAIDCGGLTNVEISDYYALNEDLDQDGDMMRFVDCWGVTMRDGTVHWGRYMHWFADCYNMLLENVTTAYGRHFVDISGGAEKLVVRNGTAYGGVGFGAPHGGFDVYLYNCVDTPDVTATTAGGFNPRVMGTYHCVDCRWHVGATVTHALGWQGSLVRDELLVAQPFIEIGDRSHIYYKNVEYLNPHGNNTQLTIGVGGGHRVKTFIVEGLKGNILSLSSDGSAPGGTANFSNIRNIEMPNATLTWRTGHDLVIENCSISTFQDNVAPSTTIYGPVPYHNQHLRNVRFSGNSDYCIQDDNGWTADNEWPSLRTYENCHFRAKRAVFASGFVNTQSQRKKYVTIDRCVFEGVPEIGMDYLNGAHDVSIREPMVTNESGAVVGTTITAGGSGYTSATVTFAAAPAGGRTATGTVTLNSGAVESITITDGGKGYTSAPAVTISGDGTGATATSTLTKTFADHMGNATGATPSVPGGFPWMLTQTGATNVTALNGISEGQTVTIIAGDANSTIVHNASSLVLAAGANFAMSAGDTLTVVKRGGIVYEIGRAT